MTPKRCEPLHMVGEDLCEQICIKCELTKMGNVSDEDAGKLQVFILQMIHGLKIGDWRQALKWRDALTRKLLRMRSR